MSCTSFNLDSTRWDLEKKKEKSFPWTPSGIYLGKALITILHYDTKLLILIFHVMKISKNSQWNLNYWNAKTKDRHKRWYFCPYWLNFQILKGSSCWSVTFSRKLWQHILGLGQRRCEMLLTLLVMVRPYWTRNMTIGLSLSFWSQFTQSEQWR